MDAKSDESRSKTILPNDTLRYALPDADGQRLIKSTTELAGTIEPVVLLAPALDIGSPTGDPDREPDASNELVFDTPANPGKCQFTVSPNAYENFTADGRERVNALCRWQIDAVGEVTPNIALNLNGTTTITYNSMPLNNSAFGRQRLTLTLNGVPVTKWRWYQDVEFFFEHEGTVHVPSPNWFTFWTQAATELGFAPLSTTYTYTVGTPPVSPESTTDLGKNTPSLINLHSQPNPNDPSNPIVTATLVTKTDIFDIAGNIGTGKYPGWDQLSDGTTGIVSFATTGGHENGHHQSYQLSASQGGFGTTLAWTGLIDSDGDNISDEWELQPTQVALGYVLNSTKQARIADNDLRAQFDHTPYNATTGAGLTQRNEDAVRARASDFFQRDWSSKGRNHR